MNGQKQQARVKRVGWLACLVLLLVTACAPAAQAQTRLIVRDSLGLPGINLTCLLTGCKVVSGLGDPNGQLFLVTLPPILNPVTALLRLNLQTGILSVEFDQAVNPPQPNSTGTPSYLTDAAPVSYYGATVWHGYLVQPGNQLIRTAQTQSAFNATGARRNGRRHRYRCRCQPSGFESGAVQGIRLHAKHGRRQRGRRRSGNSSEQRLSVYGNTGSAHGCCSRSAQRRCSRWRWQFLFRLRTRHHDGRPRAPGRSAGKDHAAEGFHRRADRPTAPTFCARSTTRSATELR